MKYFTIPEAQANLANLIERVCAGEEITLTKDGVPAVRMEAIKPRRLGMYGDSIQIAADFDAPLSPETFLPEQPHPRKKRQRTKR